jgi:peptidyl-prolyl cis-trans isomerase A (cyclophilin A)
MTTRRKFVACTALAGIAFSGCSRKQGFWARGWGRSIRRPASLSLKAPKQFTVLMETTKGNVEIEVTRDWAPLGADRFYNLVRYGFYNGARFFRVLPNFVVQFGIPADPEVAKLWKDAKIADDPVTKSNTKGYVTFATAGPNTRTTQIFINKRDNARLDAMGFAPFGIVTAGMPVVDAFESKYGEGAPRGKGPSQGRMGQEGDAYIQKEFPDLDRILKTRVIKVVK